MKIIKNDKNCRVIEFTDDEIKTLRSALGNNPPIEMEEDKVSRHINDYLHDELLAHTEILLPYEDKYDIVKAKGLDEGTENYN